MFLISGWIFVFFCDCNVWLNKFKSIFVKVLFCKLIWFVILIVWFKIVGVNDCFLVKCWIYFVDNLLFVKFWIRFVLFLFGKLGIFKIKLKWCKNVLLMLFIELEI